MAKPTGISGFFRVQTHPNGSVTGGFEQIPYSQKKEDVELATATAFIVSMDRELAKSGSKFLISTPRTNPEDDFDLTVSTPRGDAYLEMREIQPGAPYDKIAPGYNSYDFATILLKAIQTKSAHYAHPGRQLFLLMYSTHWALTPNETSLMCLRFWLAREKPVFDAIFTYQPLDAKEGVGHWVYPFPPELLGGFDPEAVKDHRCLNIDPRGFVAISSR